MTSVLIGSLLISLLHAVIPNHWLPVLAIGRKEGWSLAETTRITFIAGISHVISTVAIGVLLALIGSELATHIEDFTKIIGPSVLVLIGLYFVKQHYTHHHFHLEKKQIEKKSKSAVIIALVIAMFLSPCTCFFLPVWKLKPTFCWLEVRAGISWRLLQECMPSSPLPVCLFGYALPTKEY